MSKLRIIALLVALTALAFHNYMMDRQIVELQETIHVMLATDRKILDEEKDLQANQEALLALIKIDEVTADLRIQ